MFQEYEWKMATFKQSHGAKLCNLVSLASSRWHMMQNNKKERDGACSQNVGVLWVNVRQGSRDLRECPTGQGQNLLHHLPRQWQRCNNERKRSKAKRSTWEIGLGISIARMASNGQHNRFECDLQNTRYVWVKWKIGFLELSQSNSGMKQS